MTATPTSTAGAGDWRQDAACRGESPETFFPQSGYLSKRISREEFSIAVETARAVCRRCPVQSECLTFALEHDERWGMWGGMTEDERAAMRRERPRERKEPDHGTTAGYKQHRRLGETACESCRTADQRERRDRYARKGATA